MRPSALQPWMSPLIVGVLCLIGQSLFAQDRAVGNQQTVGNQNSGSHKQLAQLIQDLDSASFAVREQSSKALIEIGEPAIQLLSEVSPNASFEMRQRSRRVLRSIENSVFDAVSREFLFDLDASHSHGLPGWKTFRSMVGSSRTGKLLFLEMVREQPRLVELIEAVDVQRQLGNDPQAALGELSRQSVSQAAAMEQRLYELPSPGIGESAGLLFAAASIEGQAPIEVNQVISRVSQIGFYGHLRKQGYDECLKALLAQWIPKANASMAPEVMTLALELDLPSVAPTARLSLSDNFDVYTRELAFKCLAKFGSEADIPLVAAYFDDSKVVEEFIEATGGILSSNAAPPGVGQSVEEDRRTAEVTEPLPTYIVRVKDIAVLTAMLLLQEEPSTVFPNYMPNSNGMNTHALAATESDLKKQDALIKLWVETHLKPGNAG